MKFTQNFDKSTMIIDLEGEQLTIQIIQNSYGVENNAVIMLEGEQIERLKKYLNCGHVSLDSGFKGE